MPKSLALSFCYQIELYLLGNALFIRLSRNFYLFKLAKFGLILVVLIWLSILFCIDNMCLFHTLFFVSHIFSTNPVPLHFFNLLIVLLISFPSSSQAALDQNLYFQSISVLSILLTLKIINSNESAFLILISTPVSFR